VRGILAGLLLLLVCGCSGGKSEADPASGTESREPAAAQPATKTASITPKTVKVAPPPPPEPSVDADELAVVREYTQMLYRGELDLLHAKFSDEFSESFPLDKLSAVYEQIATNFGKETQVLREDSQRNEEYRAFVRFARFEKIEQVVEVQWILRAADDQIAGFFIRPARGTPDAPEQ
jgi:hypothetical protein